MWKVLIAAPLVVASPIPRSGAAAAQSDTPAELTPAEDQLGVSLTDRAVHIDPGYGTLEGALIAEVAAGSPADRAGLKARDFILKIDGVSMMPGSCGTGSDCCVPANRRISRSRETARGRPSP